MRWRLTPVVKKDDKGKLQMFHQLRPIVRKDEQKEHFFRVWVRRFGYLLFILIVVYIIKLIWF